MARIAEIKKEITIPDNVEITLENNNLTVKGENGSLSRVFSHTKINLKINGQKSKKKGEGFDRYFCCTY
jgi:ribosomal protein L6P/L9E